MAEPVHLHVGLQIRLQRIAIKMSQGELAVAIGVSLQQVQKYETARNRVSASTLYKIACHLGVAPAWFFAGVTEIDGDPQAPVHDKRITYLATAEGGQLIDHLLLLSPRLRRRVLSLVSVAAKEQAAREQPQ